jgi:hypothetical protein
MGNCKRGRTVTNQVKQWREQFLEGATESFGEMVESNTEPVVDVEELHAEIGQLMLEEDFLSGSLGKPFVFEVRDLWPELPKAMGVITNPVVLWSMSVLEWASYRPADRLVGLSPGIVEGIAARGVYKTRIAMVPDGCDLDLFASSQVAWRPEGVRADQLPAIFTGTHGNANGLDSALNAAAIFERARA